MLLFGGTSLEMSKIKMTAIRIIHGIIWISIGVSSAFLTDPSPYNIYTKSVSTDGSGITCSLFASGKVDIYTTLVLLSAGMFIFIGNIVAWSLFIYQFYGLIKFTKCSLDKGDVDELMVTIKEQTLIVGLAVGSTIFLYMVQMTGFLGQFFVTMDFVITPIIIFLCFRYNRYWFELLKCDKLAIMCCKRVENRLNIV